MRSPSFRPSPLAWALSTMLLATPSAFAAGYAFSSQSAAAQGTAQANGAEASDASVIFANPAGMARLKGTHFSQVVDLILPSLKFSQNGPATGRLSKLPTTSLAITGGNGGDAVHSHWLPHTYFSYQLDQRYTLGLGVFVPFASKVEFNDSFVGRYYALKTKLTTVNINPSLAVRLDDQNSFGFGLDFQYMNTKLQRKIAGNIPITPATDYTFNADGDSWGYGFNLGYLYEINAQTRVGFAYRSSIYHKNQGDSNTQLHDRVLIEAGAQAKIKTPATWSVNAYHELNNKWAVMGDLTLTRHTLQELVVEAQPITTTYLQTKWRRDTIRAALGAHYQLTPALKLRAGYAYDQSPVPDESNALTTMPDNDRQMLSFGGNWKLSQKDSIDFAYSYILMKKRDIKRSYDSETTADLKGSIPMRNLPTGGTTLGTVAGTYHAHGQLFGVQWNHQF